MGISGLNTPAHTFACLRIARAVVAAGARLATDLPGSALVGSVSHRLDDDSEFQGSIVSPFLSDQHCLVALAISFFHPSLLYQDRASWADLGEPISMLTVKTGARS